MKKVFLKINVYIKILLLSLIFSNFLLAKDGFYLGFNSGLAMVSSEQKGNFYTISYNFDKKQTEYKNGLLRSLKLGYQLDKYRFEIENFQHSNDIEEIRVDSINAKYTSVATSSKTKFSTLFVSFYHDISPIVISLDSNITPFLGIGLGVVSIDVVREYEGTLYNESGEGEASAWHLTGGISMKLTQNLLVDTSLRIMHYSDISYKDTIDKLMVQSYGISSAIMFGIRYKI
jgi:opacity protein-like surface antigen